MITTRIIGLRYLSSYTIFNKSSGNYIEIHKKKLLILSKLLINTFKDMVNVELLL